MLALVREPDSAAGPVTVGSAAAGATAAAPSREYVQRRAWIAEYFDRTAAAAWAQLTSDAPVSAVRRSVRAARDRTRSTLAGWLPASLEGMRVLDAGCGTGALAIELATRGAQVVAIDLSPTLVELARERTPALLRGQIDFRAGDMLDRTTGSFDYVVAMDSVIHYRLPEMLAVLDELCARTARSVLFTIVPRTPLLMTMHTLGRLFPRASRSPAVEPVSDAALRTGLRQFEAAGWCCKHTRRISAGFYNSQAVELTRMEGTA